jgi:hypothetical protein
MIYATSMPIAPKIVEYYLALLTGVIPGHARTRLSLISVGDASPRPLSEKLLGRPRLLSLIRSLVPNPLRSHLVPYNTTALERDLAVALGIPMYAADPVSFPWEPSRVAGSSSPTSGSATHWDSRICAPSRTLPVRWYVCGQRGLVSPKQWSS